MSKSKKNKLYITSTTKYFHLEKPSLKIDQNKQKKPKIKAYHYQTRSTELYIRHVLGKIIILLLGRRLLLSQ